MQKNKIIKVRKCKSTDKQKLKDSQECRDFKLIYSVMDKKYKDKVLEISYEDSDGIWVYLKEGFINPVLDAHVIHEWTWKDVVEQLKQIEKCKCEECE